MRRFVLLKMQKAPYPPMPDRKPKHDRITPHKDKLCKTCGNAFSWRPEWAQDWDIIKYCSDRCRGNQPHQHEAALEAAILELLHERDSGKTICPSEAAKLVGGRASRRDWEGLMPAARAAARHLAARGKIDVTQHGEVIDPRTAKGAIRLRLR